MGDRRDVSSAVRRCARALAHPALFLVLLAAGGARAQSDADARLSAPEGATAKAQPGAAMEKALKAVHADSPLKLTDAVQADLFALLPAARRGEECPTPATVSPDAFALKDRGDGALLVAQLTNCQGTFLMAYSPGVVPRASRLADLDEGQTLAEVHAMNLRGLKREDDLAVAVHVGLVRDSMRFFLRGSGFTFSDGGTLKEFAEHGDCAAGGDVTGGFASFLRIDSGNRLQVLRVDTVCSGGSWQAKCELWTVDGGLAQAGVCALPAKLDAKSMRAAGWK